MTEFTPLESLFVFGVGLVISGMSDPAKVLNFLDLFGTWDLSLPFVLGGAVIVAFVGFRLVLSRPKPIRAEKFHLPTRADIDRRIVGGPAIFGTGWGLGGFCPGPALTAFGLAAPGTLAFVPAILAGMWVARLFGEQRPSTARGVTIAEPHLNASRRTAMSCR